MQLRKDVALKEILDHVHASGRNYAGWYAGITKDPEDRLFVQHNVKDWYIYRECYSSSDARDLEAYLIDTLGFDGGPGGGDEDSNFVYAYLKQMHTSE